MTAHQKLQLTRHLESALRCYTERLSQGHDDSIQSMRKDCQETLKWLSNMETKG